MTPLDFDSDLRFEDAHLLLRPWRDEDAELVAPGALDPEIWRYTTSALRTTQDVADYVARATDDRRTGRRYSLAVCIKPGRTIVGSSSFGNLSLGDGRLELGWTWLTAAHQGTGVNSRVKYLMLRYCFEQLKAHRVEFKTDAANLRSCAALKKIGARPEGILRAHTLMHDGRYRDTAYFSILAAEWPEVRRSLAALSRTPG